MSWAKIDDALITDLKTRALSHVGFRVWVLGLVHCQQGLTDGFIADSALSLFGVQADDLRTSIDELTRSLVRGKKPLWHQVEGGYQVNDWSEWHPKTAEQIKAEKRKDADRKRGVRAAVHADVRGDVQADGTPESDRPVQSNPNKREKAEAPKGNEVVAAYCDAFNARYKRMPHITGQMAKLLKGIGESKGVIPAQQAVIRFLADDKPFLVNAGHPVQLLWNQLDGYLPAAPVNEGPLLQSFTDIYRDLAVKEGRA